MRLAVLILLAALSLAAQDNSVSSTNALSGKPCFKHLPDLSVCKGAPKCFFEQPTVLCGCQMVPKSKIGSLQKVLGQEIQCTDFCNQVACRQNCDYVACSYIAKEEVDSTCVSAIHMAEVTFVRAANCSKRSDGYMHECRKESEVVTLDSKTYVAIKKGYCIPTCGLDSSAMRCSADAEIFGLGNGENGGNLKSATWSVMYTSGGFKFSNQLPQADPTGPTTGLDPALPTGLEPPAGTEPDLPPAPEPVPSSEPAPEPVPSSEPAPEPVPSSEPAPEPVPSSEPAPEPVPSSEPAPEPVPSSEPAPEPAPSSEPAPEPAPSSEPAPEPSPLSPTVDPGTVGSEGDDDGGNDDDDGGDDDDDEEKWIIAGCGIALTLFLCCLFAILAYRRRKKEEENEKQEGLLESQVAAGNSPQALA